MSLNFIGAVFAKLDMIVRAADRCWSALLTSQPMNYLGFVDVSTGCGIFENLIHGSFARRLAIGRNVFKYVHVAYCVEAH